MSGFVVDANVMHAFQKERIYGEAGHAGPAIESIMISGFIALDDGGLCQSEWLECAGGSHPYALHDWIADQMVMEKIRLYPFCQDSMYKELSAFGVPKKDHKWVRLARGSSNKVIVTDDIDLFEPTLKKASADKIAKAKQNRSGRVCKHLKKNHKIDVICPCHVQDFCN